MSNILIIGGSGFVSGTTAELALAQGHKVWTVTRGQRSVPEGVISLVADRHDSAAFAQAIAEANTTWDLAIDCIAFAPEDIEQDIATLKDRAAHLAFVSTDFVFDPRHRQLPQAEETDYYLESGYGQKKRQGEEVLLNSNTGDMRWTTIRPCHIYGPGSKLGCLPLHGRDEQLIDRLKAGESLKLAGGGYFLQQPIFARDLAALLLSVAQHPETHGEIYCAAGPDIIESRRYYEIIAEVLGVDLHVEEIPVDQTLAENPNWATFLCHRIYDLSKLQASGLAVPATSMEAGLKEHVNSLLASDGVK